MLFASHSLKIEMHFPLQLCKYLLAFKTCDNVGKHSKSLEMWVTAFFQGARRTHYYIVNRVFDPMKINVF